MKISYNLNDKSYFKQRQIINLNFKLSIKILKGSQSDSSNLVSLDHQLLKSNHTLTIDKMNCKDISIIISSKVNIPTSQFFLKNDFLSIIFNEKACTHFRLKSL